MGMFIFKRELLVEAIKTSYSKGLVHLERDFLQKAHNDHGLKISVYEFDGVVLRNESISTYFKNNMALLDKDVRDGLFLPGARIYTKVRDEFPTYYGAESTVDNCLLADGCIINGTIKNSVLFRDVNIEADAIVKNSIIMQGTKVGKGAQLECVILDKDVTVTDGAVLKGTPSHPVIIKKGEEV